MGPQKKEERLHSAAIVKLKYQLLSGGIDEGFKTVYAGVLQDLKLTEEEVDGYIDEHRDELRKICLGDG